MSLLHMDGFDQFANAGNSTAVAETMTLAGYTATFNAADALLIAAGREANSSAVQLRQTRTGTVRSAGLTRTFTSEADVVRIGFAYKATERSTIVKIGALPALEWPVGCKLNGVEGEAIPIRNIWYYFEIELDKLDQKMRLYINNRLDIEAPAPAELGAMTSYSVTFGSTLTGTIETTQMIDDLVFSDSAGTEFNTRKGPIQITTLTPSGDVTADWEASQPGTLASMVNKRPPQAGYYIQSNTGDAEATFTPAGTLPTDAPVYAIGMVVRAMKTDLDRRAIGLIWGDGVNRIESRVEDLTTDFKYFYRFFEAPAPGQAWSKEILELNSFGVKTRAYGISEGVTP